MKKQLVWLLAILLLLQPSWAGFSAVPAALYAEEPGGTSMDDAIPFVYGAETAVDLAANSYKYFVYTPDITGTYIFSSSNLTAGSPQITIYSPVQVAASPNAYGRTDIYLPVTLAAGRPYYIRLYCNTQTQFSFIALRTADDHANQQDLAAPFSLETGAGGWLEYPGDADAFTLHPLYEVMLEFSVDTAAQYKLTVDGYDLSGPPYQRNMSAGAAHTVVVKEISPRTGSYQPRPYLLRAAAVPDDAGNSDAAAAALAPDTPRSGRIDYAGDKDVYSFTADEETSGTYRLQIDGPPDILCDPLVRNGYAPVSAGDWRLIERGAGSSKYFTITGSAGSEYTIALMTQPDDYANATTYLSPGSVRAEIPVAGELEYEGDIDMFRILFATAAYYPDDSEFLEPGYYSLRVAGLTGPQSVYFDGIKLDGPESEPVLFTDGAHYVRVEAAGATGSYTLLLQKEGPTPSPPPDAEPNTAAEALLLPAEPSYDGTIDFSGDTDWFVFTADEESVYQLEAPGENCILTILSEDLIPCYEQTVGNMAGLVLLEPNSLYYVRLTHGNRTFRPPLPYRLRLTKAATPRPSWAETGENSLSLSGAAAGSLYPVAFSAPVSSEYTFRLTGDSDLHLNSDGYTAVSNTEIKRILAQGAGATLTVSGGGESPRPFTLTAAWTEDDYPGETDWWLAPLMDLDTSYTMRCDYDDDIDGLKLPAGLSGLYSFRTDSPDMTNIYIVYEENGEIVLWSDIPYGSSGYLTAELQADKQYYVAVDTVNTDAVGAVITLTARAGADDHPDGLGGGLHEEPAGRAKEAAGAIDYAGDADVFSMRPFFGPARFRVSAARPLQAEIFALDQDRRWLPLATAEGTEIDLYALNPALSEWTYHTELEFYYLRLTAAGDDAGITYTVRAEQADDYRDTFTAARAAAEGETLAGAVQFAGDADLFRFTPLLTAAYNFDFGPEDEALTWTLYDLTGTELLSGHGGGFARTLQAFAPYYLRLGAAEGAQPAYELTIRYAPPDDYGNGPGEAFALGEGGRAGVIDYNGDLDYFSFTPVLSGHYSLTGGGRHGLVAELSAADGTVLASATGESFAFRHKFTAGQTYYFSLRPQFRDRLGAYDFTLTALEDEAGESVAEALALNLPHTEEHSLGFAGDADYYALTAAAGGTYTFRSAGPLDLRAELLDAGGALIAAGDDEGAEKNFYIIAPLRGGELYYLAVQGQTGEETGSYDLLLRRETDDIPDSAAAAPHITLPYRQTQRVDFPGDVDYYALTAAEEETIVVTFGGDTAPVRGTLYDGEGRTLAEKTITAQERALVCKPGAGTFYLAVRHQLDQGKYDGSAYGPYALEIQADRTTPSPPANFTAVLSGESVLISFDPATDDTGVAAYDIYRNGWLLQANAATVFTDHSTTWNKTYTYYARARDRAGKTSAPSESVTVTTGADVTPP
ncbi:MAG: fibronectin type III domain-containing protein, partial [Gracilibacteraceae bacterium]|nr:fibronectin type III domain-containing protein [Gracilibacteraceae bacterium]